MTGAVVCRNWFSDSEEIFIPVTGSVLIRVKSNVAAWQAREGFNYNQNKNKNKQWTGHRDTLSSFQTAIFTLREELENIFGDVCFFLYVFWHEHFFICVSTLLFGLRNER